MTDQLLAAITELIKTGGQLALPALIGYFTVRAFETIIPWVCGILLVRWFVQGVLTASVMSELHEIKTYTYGVYKRHYDLQGKAIDPTKPATGGDL